MDAQTDRVARVLTDIACLKTACHSAADMQAVGALAAIADEIVDAAAKLAIASEEAVARSILCAYPRKTPEST